MFSSSHRRRAFTLVELLVVLGILVLLIAILLPAVGRVRRQAQEVKCAAHLRSIGQALTMYTQQYGFFPSASAIAPGGNNFVIWPTRLRRFLADGEGVFYCPSQDERCEWKRGDSSAGPTAGDLENGFGYHLGERLLREGQYFSYGYNGWGTYSEGRGQLIKGLGPHIIVADPYNVGGLRELKASRVRLPSEMIAVGDSTADGRWDHHLSPLPGTQGAIPGSIHRGGANLLFCDGHVQWYPQKDLVRPQSFGSPEERFRWQAMEQMWNYDHSFSMFN